MVLDGGRLPALRPALRARSRLLDRRAAINTILVGGVFVIAFVIALVLTVPDVPVAPLLAILVPIVLIGPLVTYPFSKTLWFAIDRAYLQRLDPNERPDEQVRHY